MVSLDAFGSGITVDKALTDPTDPVLQISYEPSPPSLTIRTIMSTIASSGSPEFKVSIHEDATLEDLAQKMRVKEQKRLLRRLITSLVVGISTFVLAIVYGSLVKRDNTSKIYLMEPTWIGNTSRLDWALFFLATPVMFYSANLFHQRSIKEIRGLWKRGSRTPIWRRFICFGSMNMLVRILPHLPAMNEHRRGHRSPVVYPWPTSRLSHF
jgi:Cu+-exporting ATPase